MTLYPLNDRVLVRPATRPERTKGGVLLPDTVRHEDIGEGRVVDCGSSSLVYDNERIVYTKYAGSEVNVDGETLLLIPDKNILGRWVRDSLADYDIPDEEA